MLSSPDGFEGTMERGKNIVFLSLSLFYKFQDGKY